MDKLRISSDKRKNIFLVPLGTSMEHKLLKEYIRGIEIDGSRLSNVYLVFDKNFIKDKNDSTLIEVNDENNMSLGSVLSSYISEKYVGYKWHSYKNEKGEIKMSEKSFTYTDVLRNWTDMYFSEYDNFVICGNINF